jgi:hypothetical protein
MVFGPPAPFLQAKGSSRRRAGAGNDNGLIGGIRKEGPRLRRFMGTLGRGPGRAAGKVEK